ncbi:heparinase II/III domain-containing protein [Paenibacillus aceris]|uniref:Alginate lyase domain-containing protein n=1 Tax=Paenibacillus aceris TaxID=869555 RepID=A0ABS4I3N2_9BACL|nr:heparinase II/III family protein [Paenibacillus aceris]MBP1965515.1 hypothetical protein [Paenibacillus aceris]NHW33436.1 hypothetical protein [Paenibacillus aceris]
MYSLHSAAWLEQFRSRLRAETTARKALAHLMDRMASIIASPPVIPLTGGGWSHAYVCPADGTRLQTVTRVLHRCPLCQQEMSGSPYDEVVIAEEHSEFSKLTLTAALSYAATEEAKYAEWAKQVILFYAEHYASFDLHDIFGKSGNEAGRYGARVQNQTLSEAMWIIPLAQAFTIIKSCQMWTEMEMQSIELNLFRPVIAVIDRNPRGESNWQSYHNAAAAVIAEALGDKELFERALNDPRNGFHFQMEQSVGKEGFWFEGSWGYHFFTLSALITIVHSAAAFDVPLNDDRKFQIMFRIPLEAHLPDYTFPAVHDSMETDLRQYADLYEFAYAEYGLGDGILQQSERNSLHSLLYGKDIQPETEEHTDKADYKDIRVIDLTKPGMLYATIGTGPSAQAALVDYGEHGGWHGHLDKLNLIYYAGGRCWLTDAGMLGYSHPLHDAWFRQTIAHNTIVVSGRSQSPSTGVLRKVKTNEQDGSVRICAEVGDAYEGVRMERIIRLTNGLLIDECKVICDREEDIDWVFHTPGVPILPSTFGYEPVSSDQLSESDGYSYLMDIRRLTGLPDNDRMLEWKWNETDAEHERLQMYGIGAFSGNLAEEEWYLAESPGMAHVKRRSALIRRLRKVRETSIVSVFRVCAKGDEWLAVPFKLDCFTEGVIGEP